jgi:hypothetical protein
MSSTAVAGPLPFEIARVSGSDTPPNESSILAGSRKATQSDEFPRQTGRPPAAGFAPEIDLRGSSV